jgi:large subunit ribosomal protein L24
LQTTLLGIGIAIILALIAALAGPYVIDWRSHRAMFESEASRLVGAPTRIEGAIDVRLLPVPSVTLRDVKIAGAGAEAKLAAREVGVEFALGPLIRGEWRITDMRLVAPTIRAGIDAAGRLDWGVGRSARETDAFSIDQLSVEDATLILSDAASKGHLQLDHAAFKGEVRALSGPIRGEGQFVSGTERFGYRLALNRKADDGSLRVRLNVDPADQPLTNEIDGALTLENGVPEFSGTFVRTRTPDVKLSAGQVVANQPWRVTTKMHALPAGATLEHIEVAYGTEPRTLKLTGGGKFTFGAAPKLDATLTARQADLDRLAALPAATRQLPLVALGALARPFDGAPPAFPVKLSVRVDNITLGGGVIRDFHGALIGSAEGWRIESADFRAPGGTVVSAKGALGSVEKAVSFAGPAKVEAADATALAAWLEGRTDTGAARLGTFQASGDVTVAKGRFAIDHLDVTVDRKAISGRLAYDASDAKRPAKLDLDLKAAELDVDGTVALLQAALPNLAAAMPAEIFLNADLNAATYAGVRARDFKAKLNIGASGLVVERATIGDLAGASVAASGRVQGPWSKPRGALTLDIAGDDMHGVADAIAGLWPSAAAVVNASIPRLAPAKLRAALNFSTTEGGAPQTTLRLTGMAAGVAVTTDATVQGDLADATSWDTRVTTAFDAKESTALIRLLNLDRIVAGGTEAGALRVTASGRLGGDLSIEGKLAAGGLDGNLRGRVSVLSKDGPHGEGTISVKAADVTSLRGIFSDAGAPSPVSLKARINLEPQRTAFEEITGHVGGNKVGGRLAFAGEGRVDGRIDADTIDVPGLIGAFAAMPIGAGAWSSEPFASRLLSGWTGDIALAAARARLTPKLEAGNFKAGLKFDGSDATLDAMRATLANGRMSGRVALQGTEAGLTAATEMTLSGADLETLTRDGGRAPLAGKLDFQVDAKGFGRTPAALAASLTGSGTLTIKDAAVAGLDPRAFDAVTRLAEQGVSVDADKLRSLVDKALERDRLALGRVDAAFTMSAGQAQLANLTAHGDRADLDVNAIVDLTRRTLDARLTLVGPAQSGAGPAGRPQLSVMLQGPLEAPKRSVDVSALLGWLTLRSVDVQSKRLEAAEAERRATEEALRRAEEAAKQRAKAEADAQAKREAERKAREAAVVPTEAPNIMREEDAPGASPTAPASVPLPPSRPVTRGPAAPAAAPAPAASESAPALPPPVDIRPAPAARRANTHRSDPNRRAGSISGNAAPPPRPAPNVFERLLGLGR